MKCCFCGKDAGKYGNNARPLKDGFCCDHCNSTKVIPARLRDVKKYYCSKHGGEGDPNCPECIKNLKRLAIDNNALLVGDIK